VSKLPGINHLGAVAALEKAGFRILRQGAHIVMTDGTRILTIPRHSLSMLSRWAALSAMQD
jgi:predicted RNA binding protein YcfA (HicA-like mRNA interferase family)